VADDALEKAVREFLLKCDIIWAHVHPDAVARIYQSDVAPLRAALAEKEQERG
jgi:hypothetical protein